MTWSDAEFEAERAAAVERLTLRLDAIMRKRASNWRNERGVPDAQDWMERQSGAAREALTAPW